MPMRASTSNGSAHCCFGEGRGKHERVWPPHPAGRGGQGSSRCLALRDRSMAGLPCSASGKARLPHQPHGQLRSPAGRKALGRLRCRIHESCPHDAAYRAHGPCSESCTRLAGRSPRCRAKARMVHPGCPPDSAVRSTRRVARAASPSRGWSPRTRHRPSRTPSDPRSASNPMVRRLRPAQCASRVVASTRTRVRRAAHARHYPAGVAGADWCERGSDGALMRPSGQPRQELC